MCHYHISVTLNMAVQWSTPNRIGYIQNVIKNVNIKNFRRIWIFMKNFSKKCKKKEKKNSPKDKNIHVLIVKIKKNISEPQIFTLIWRKIWLLIILYRNKGPWLTPQCEGG